MDLLRNCYSLGSDSSDDETNNDPKHHSSRATTSKLDDSPSTGKLLSTNQNSEQKSNDSSEEHDKNTRLDFFSLNDSDDSSENEVENTTNITPQSNLTGAFWNPKGPEVIPWDEPEKLWSSPSVPKAPPAKSVQKPHHQRKRHFEQKPQIFNPKKFRGPATQDSPLQAKPLTRSPFFIHHKVAPFLHQTISNKTSRSPMTKESEHGGCVNAVVWCSQSEYSHLLLSASHDRTIKLWNGFSKDGISCLQTITGHDKGVRAVQWINGGRHVLSASYDKTARIFDIEKGAEISCFRHSGYVSSLSVHPVNPNYFLTGSNNCLQCWDVRVAEKSMRKFVYKDKFGQVEDIAMMANGTQFFTCNDNVTRDSADRNVMAWDFNKAVVLSNQIYQERYTCTKLVLHPDQSQFLAQTNGDYMALFSTIRPYKLNKYKRFEGHKVQGHKVGCDFSPDGRTIASGSADGNVYFYDVVTAKLAKKIRASAGAVMPVSWHPVLPSIVACGSDDGSITVFQ